MPGRCSCASPGIWCGSCRTAPPTATCSASICGCVPIPGRPGSTRDLRLRPDPGSTQVAIATDAALTYYERAGETWERAAFIKARAAAGDVSAGEAFLKDLSPFVWRRYLDHAAIAEVHAMKRQIHAFRG